MKSVSVLPVEIDDSILFSLKESKEELISQMKLYTAISLYRKNRLSLGKAAEFAGMSKLDFIDRFKQEAALFDYSDEVLESIQNDANELVTMIK